VTLHLGSIIIGEGNPLATAIWWSCTIHQSSKQRLTVHPRLEGFLKLKEYGGRLQIVFDSLIDFLKDYLYFYLHILVRDYLIPKAVHFLFYICTKEVI